MEFVRKGSDVAIIACGDGRRILFSYGEPVAAWLPSYREPYQTRVAPAYQRIDEFVSRTTERHITEFLAGARALRVPRAVLREIVEDAG